MSFCLLVGTVLIAKGIARADSPKATASASLDKQIKALKQRVARLQQRVVTLSQQPGPQGAAGPSGDPACQGNGATDVMVDAGSVCIDRYEVSIWDAPTGGNQITGGLPCSENGQDCINMYARSVPGVAPRANITWFQAQQALANVGKRLPTNAEWQQAVAGTPDPGATPGAEDCNTSSAGAVATGSRDGCLSRHGANDMVGNLWEWTADWDQQALSCANWPAGFGGDVTCIGRATGDPGSGFPGALIRGGHFAQGAGAGPFAVSGAPVPSTLDASIGFRGAR